MGTVLSFEPSLKSRPGIDPGAPADVCQIVIFPGVRIERHDLDLGHRVVDSAGHGDFDGLGGKGRPRKTS
jgi:hypothetical protein